MLRNACIENRLCYLPALFRIGKRTGNANLLSIFVCCPNCFLQLVTVFSNNLIGRTYNSFGRAVVLFQFKNLGICVMLLKVEYVLNISSTEGIYTLRIIAHHTYIKMPCCKLAQYHILRKVSILVLIYQYITEHILVL